MTYFPTRRVIFFFNFFLDDMVVYLPSAEDNVIHLHEVLERLKRAGFTLNPDKGTLGAREIKYLGHLHASWRIKILT